MPITQLPALLCALMMRTLPFALHLAGLAWLETLPRAVAVVAEVVAWFHAGRTGGTTREVADVPAYKDASTIAGALDVQTTETALPTSAGAFVLTLQDDFTRIWARGDVSVHGARQLNNMAAGEFLGHHIVTTPGARV